MRAAAWLRKGLVILVSVVTFGLITPTDLAWLAEADSQKASKKGLVQEEHRPFPSVQEDRETDEQFDRAAFISGILMKAEENVQMKFGEKINLKIGDEFKETIFPKMQETIHEVASQYPDEELKQFLITKQPSAGRAEKIFHIYDASSGNDVIRFHVRQENPPLEGYWFNFHYHTAHDSFAAHHDIGKIYWDRNTPPSWKSQRVIS